MRKVAVANLKGNEILAKTIYTNTDSILLGKGISIKKSYIQKLQELDIEYLYIEDELSQGIEIDDYINERTRIASKQEVRKIMDRYAVSGRLDLDNVGRITESIIGDILDKKEVIVNLSEIRGKDEYSYAHNVNVACLSILTSVKMGDSIERSKEIGVGAILHDLGKIRLPAEVREERDDLNKTQWEQYGSHVLLGYEAVKDEKWLSAVAKVIILTHHERVNGSGFPYGWPGEKLHQAVKIVSVCDVFDRMTNKRTHGEIYKTYEVIEYLVAMKGTLFDPDIVDAFIGFIALYPSGSGVMTNKSDFGIVVRQNPGLPTRPIIRLLKNSSGDNYPSNHEVDLSKELSLFIIDTYDI